MTKVMHLKVNSKQQLFFNDESATPNFKNIEDGRVHDKLKMKAKKSAILIVLALLAYWLGLCNASAFYDPGIQRWLNRDPIAEKSFNVVHHTVTIGTDYDLSLYEFVDNNPQGDNDAFGLDPTGFGTISIGPPEISSGGKPIGITRVVGTASWTPCNCPSAGYGGMHCLNQAPGQTPPWVNAGCGAIIMTGPNSGVEIHNPDGTELRVGSNAIDSSTCIGNKGPNLRRGPMIFNHNPPQSVPVSILG